MSTQNSEPDQIRARIDALLAELPAETDIAELPADADIDALAQHLQAAHDVLVRALESVEKD